LDLVFAICVEGFFASPTAVRRPFLVLHAKVLRGVAAQGADPGRQLAAAQAKPFAGLLPKNPIWWRFMSHKIMRLVVPFFLILMFGANFLLPGFPYPLFLAAQIACYGAEAAAVAFPKLRCIHLLNLLYFLCVLNAAAAASFITFAAGCTRKLWARPASDVS
jgi:hypothetical protein